MGIIVPAWGFSNVAHNFSGTPPPQILGTTFNTGGNNSDAASVTVLSALTFDVHYLIVGIAGIAVTTNDCSALLDVLVDPAGGTSWVAFIDDLVCGCSGQTNTTVNMNRWYHFPVFIKSGNSVGVRAKTVRSTQVATGRVTMYAFGNPSRPEQWWCGQKVESLGINAGTSQGTDVTPGDTGTFGSWTSIGTTTHPWGAIQLGLNASDNNATARGYFWQVGYGSTRLPGMPMVHFQTTAAEEHYGIGLQIPVWCDIPAGTTMQARATCSGTAEVIDAALYGVY